MSPEVEGVSFVILAKEATLAKTRLSANREQACALARRLAHHTIETTLAARSMGAVFVVTSDPGIKGCAKAHGVAVVEEGSPVGMNAAAAMGRRHALNLHPQHPVAVLVADLPLLQPDDLEAVVDEFRDAGTPLFVADHEGVGTTLLIHGPDERSGLAFGRRSAEMHRRLGYVPASDPLRGLRRDLDTREDLLELDSTWRRSWPGQGDHGGDVSVLPFANSLRASGSSGARDGRNVVASVAAHR